MVRNPEVNKNNEEELLEATRHLKPNELSGMIETPTGVTFSS